MNVEDQLFQRDYSLVCRPAEDSVSKYFEQTRVHRILPNPVCAFEKIVHLCVRFNTPPFGGQENGVGGHGISNSAR